MTREVAIEQLKMDRDLCNFINPLTGEEDPINEDCRKSAVALDMAIKALEQEPCKDCVSRQAVLYALDKRFDFIPIEQTTEILLLRKDLRELPPVTPPGWIPVSERLPEFAQDVLLSLRSLDITTGFRAETEPYFYCHGVDGCYIEPQNVLAWRPLPEPYKVESKVR